MQHPLNERAPINSDAAAELGRFRPYLLMLARMQFDGALQAKLSESDIVQQTLLEAHQALARFRGATDSDKAAWLRRILARNLADELRKYRRDKRNLQLEQSLEVALNESTARLERWLAVESSTPSQFAIVNEHIVALAAALLKLPEDQRRAVELHHLQGLSSAMVAQRMNKTEIAVAGLLRRGLKRLRELICNDDVG